MTTEKVSQHITAITIAFLEKVLIGVQNFSPIACMSVAQPSQRQLPWSTSARLSVLAANLLSSLTSGSNSFPRL